MPTATVYVPPDTFAGTSQFTVKVRCCPAVNAWLSNHWSFAFVTPSGAMTATSTRAFIVVALVSRTVIVTDWPAETLVGETDALLTKLGDGTGVGAGLLGEAVGATVGEGATVGVATGVAEGGAV